MAQKTMDGSVPEDGAFQFELIDAENNVLATVSNNEAGIVAFEQIVFEQPGTYVYCIREVRGDDENISYDAHEEFITITVTDDGEGNLTATSSLVDTLPTFANETKPGTLTLTKQTEGSDAQEEFTFEIELTNESGQPLDSIHIVGEGE